MLAEHDDVGQAHVLLRLEELFALCPVAHQQEADVRLVLQALGGLQDRVQAVGHAVGADVGGQEHALAQAKFPARGVHALAGSVALQVRAVGHDADLAARDAPAHDVAFEGVGQGDDVVGLAVQEALDPFEGLDHAAILDSAHGDDGFGPQVADLQHPRAALHARHEVPGHAAEELGRGGHDQVHVLHPPALGHGREHEGHVVGRALGEALVGAQVGADAQHLDAVLLLPGVERIPEARIDHAAGVARVAGQDRDPVAGAHPALGVLVGARGRGVHLGREIVAQKEDMHVSAVLLDDDETARPGQSGADADAQHVARQLPPELGAVPAPDKLQGAFNGADAKRGRAGPDFGAAVVQPDRTVRVDMHAQFQVVLAAALDPVADLDAPAAPFDAAAVHGPSGQPRIAVVGALENQRHVLLRRPRGHGPGPARHAVRAPDFGLVMAVDGQRVVPRIAPVVVPDVAVRVPAAARVHDDAPPVQGQLEAQSVAMGVAGLVVRPDRTAVRHEHVAGTGREAVIPAFRKGPHRFVPGRRTGPAQPPEIPGQFGVARLDAQGRVVEERDAAVRVGQALGKIQHGRNQPLQPQLQRPHLGQAAGVAEVQEIQAVLQDHAVVHGAALEMTAVGQDLFGQLLGGDTQTKVQPAPGFHAVEKDPGKDQGLGVLEIVVGQQMVFDVLGEPAGLHGQAFQPRCRKGPRTGRQEKLDPVDEPQRHGKRLPRICPALRVARYPALDQFRPVGAPRLMQTVEIVQVVAPELVLIHGRPIEADGVEALAHADEGQSPRLAAAVARQWRRQRQTRPGEKGGRRPHPRLRPQSAQQLIGDLARR